MYTFDSIKVFAMAAVLQGLLPVNGLAQEAPEPDTRGAGPLVDKLQSQSGRKPAGGRPSATDKRMPKADAKDEGDPTPLGVNLKKLELVPQPPKAKTGSSRKGRMPAAAAPATPAPGLNLPPHLEENLQKEFVDQPLSMAALNRVLKRITTAYKETDFPLVDAYLPEQDITKGRVEVIVREAVLGAVRVEGVKRTDPNYLIRQIRVKRGDRIDTALIESDVEWLNESPARKVNVIYERGATDGTSDVILKAEEMSTFHLYSGFANSGIQATGMNEWSGGFNWSEIFGTQQTLGYNFSGNNYLDKINTHAVVYGIALPWRHQFQLIGVYATTKVESGAPGSTLGVNGETRQLTAAYTIPLPRPWRNVHNNLTIAADYKSTNSDIFFGGQSLTTTDAEVLQFRLGYDVTVTDPFGYTHLGVTGVYSPGNLLTNNTDAAFGLLRQGAQADYSYGKVDFDRLVRLPKRFSLALHASGQRSSKRLISTEQMQAGGYRTVRGFAESTARGDSGVLANVELNFPSFPLISWGDKRVDDMTFFVFYDTAYLTSAGTLASEPNQSLQSAGAGFRYSVKDYLDLRFAYGWNVGDSGIQNAPPGHVHFGATVKF